MHLHITSSTSNCNAIYRRLVPVSQILLKVLCNIDSQHRQVVIVGLVSLANMVQKGVKSHV